MRRKNSAADRHHHHHGHSDRARSSSPPATDHMSRKQRAPGSSRPRADSRGYDSDGDPFRSRRNYIQNALDEEVANQERRGRERNHTLGEALNHSDPEWRAKVDSSIKTLARSLEKLHQKLDQFLPPADLVAQHRNIAHNIYSQDSPADRLEATDPNDEHQGSGDVGRQSSAEIEFLILNLHDSPLVMPPLVGGDRGRSLSAVSAASLSTLPRSDHTPTRNGRQPLETGIMKSPEDGNQTEMTDETPSAEPPQIRMRSNPFEGGFPM